MLGYLKNILQLLLSPGNAWEDISHEGRGIDSLLYRCYVPFAGVVSLSSLVQLIYTRHASAGTLVLDAIATFVSFFACYFLSTVLLQTFVSKMVKGAYNQYKFSVVTIYALSLLLVWVLVDNVMPTHLSLIYLLMVSVALVIWKASLFLAIDPQEEYRFAGIASAIILIPPIALIAFFQGIIGL